MTVGEAVARYRPPTIEEESSDAVPRAVQDHLRPQQARRLLRRHRCEIPAGTVRGTWHGVPHPAGARATRHCPRHPRRPGELSCGGAAMSVSPLDTRTEDPTLAEKQ